jgi:hypothetical protein
VGCRVYEGISEKVANSKKLKKKFEDSLSLFVINPFNPKLRTHKVSGPRCTISFISRPT